MNPNKQWRNWLWWGLAASILAALAYTTLRTEPIPVDVVVVTHADMRETVGDEGRTRIRETFIVSAPVTGRLLRLDVHAGDNVIAGTTIVAVIEAADPAMLDIRTRAQAEANVKAAEAALRLAQEEKAAATSDFGFASTELRRAQALSERGILPKVEFDRRELAYRNAQSRIETTDAVVRMRAAELETARAMLISPNFGGDLVEEDTSRSIPVRSPESGRILRIFQQSEAVVTAGTPLLEVGNPDDLEILVELLSFDAVKVSEGASVEITGWGGTEILTGRVRRVEPYGFTKVSALGVEEQRVNTIVDVDKLTERATSLGHGFRVDTRIEIWRGEHVLQAPLGCIFRVNGKWATFVYSNGRAVLRPIEIGHLNEQAAEIISGLEAGDTLILYPTDRIADGAPVAARGSQ